MFKTFYPDRDFDSTYDIDFEALKQQGYKAVLFDVDNTLVPHGAPADDRAIAFFDKLKSLGFKACLISNNKEPRVKSFAAQVNCDYIYKAHKPSPKGYLDACAKLGVNNTEAVFVGDQLFTDVWGAKKAKILSFLVKPINPKEEIQIVIKRRLEWIVLFFYRRHKKKNAKH